MATTVKDGGPAFPQHLMETRAGAFQCSYDAPDGGGMSLRDYFAAQVIGMAAHDIIEPTDVAERAYAVADAMLAERDK